MNILGIDVGNATTVTNTGLIFDSKVSYSKPIAGDYHELVLDGKTYYIGAGEYDTEYNKVEKKAYLPLLFSAIALSKSRGTNFNIVLGLPLSQYNSYNKALTNKIVSNNDKVIQIDGNERHIIIDDVAVFPESIFTVSDDFEGIVIDVGGRTTDCAMIEINRGKKKILEPTSLPIGTINLYQNSIEKINTTYALDLKINDAERILRNGLYLDGEKENIDFAKRVFEDFVENLISKLQLKFSLRTNRISVTGGGADIIYKYLVDRIGNNVEKQKEPILANAKNYYELGLSVFEE